MKHTIVFGLVLLAACSTATTATPVAIDSDELDIKATVLAAYNVVSGPAGRRDWDRFKELFAPGAQVTHVMPDGSAKALVPDDFITIAKPILDQQGLFEHPVTTRVQHAGALATVLTTFESRHATTDAAAFQKGVDAFELIKSNGAWKILSITRTMTP